MSDFVSIALNPFRRLIGVMPPAKRHELWAVFGAAVLTAFFETAGVLSILPFMAIVMDPGALDRYPPLATLMHTLGLESHQQAVLAVGCLTIGVLALGNAANALNLWVQSRFLATARRELSAELFNGYLRQPYAFHVQRDAASLTKVAFADVESALGGFLASLLAAFTKGLVAIALVGLLLWRDPWVAMGIVALLGGGYFGVYKMVRRKQGQLGAELSAANVLRSRSALEGLGGVKELRVLGREASSMSTFAASTEVIARTQVWSTLIGTLPRYVIEILAFGGIVAITLVNTLRGDPAGIIPTLALYAFAAYRLLPAFQQFYVFAVTLKYHSPAVASLEADLALVRRPADPMGEQTDQPLAFTQQIEVESLSFRYPGAQRDAIDNVSLMIERNQSIGLVGKTGSGKTTLVDLLLGLYRPTDGSIRIDGVTLGADNERAWRLNVGYVPQQVFLANASIAQNIALGLPPGEIDRSKVERAARMAQAEEFIKQLPQGYDSVVGERGVKLSGGQRQRLGIARALYDDPAVLVFDEATSALDGMTEDAVMQAIRSLSTGRTVVLIAHRLRTVQACDRIVMLEAGQIVADGPHDELLNSSLPFRRLAGSAEESRQKSGF